MKFNAETQHFTEPMPDGSERILSLEQVAEQYTRLEARCAAAERAVAAANAYRHDLKCLAVQALQRENEALREQVAQWQNDLANIGSSARVGNLSLIEVSHLAAQALNGRPHHTPPSTNGVAAVTVAGAAGDADGSE